MTDYQKLQRHWLQEKMKPHHSSSFFGSILGGLKHGTETALDYASRPYHAVAGAYDEAIKHHSGSILHNLGLELHGAYKGITGHEHKTFNDVLKDAGVLKGHGTLRSVAGLTLDVALDPTTYLSGGAVGVGRAAIEHAAAREAALGLEKGSILKASHVALHGAKDSKEARWAKGILGKAGHGYQARHALADFRIQEHALRDIPLTNPVAKVFHHQLHGLEAVAKTEKRLMDGARNVELRYKLPGLPGLNVKTPFKAPEIKRIAAREGILGHAPLLHHGASFIGKTFKPEWGQETFHSLERVAARTTEQLNKEYADLIKGKLIHHKGILSDSEMLHALHVGETSKGIVLAGKHARTLNEHRLAALVRGGKISEKQANFIRDWHSVTEELRHLDIQFGRKVPPLLKGAEQSVLYVPHIYTKDGRKLRVMSNFRSILSKKGFEYERLAKTPQSAQMLRELNDQGIYRDIIETDPMRIMLNRARRGAQAHADAMMQEVVKRSVGTPLKLADKARLAQVAALRDEVKGKLDELYGAAGRHTTLTAEGLQKLHDLNGLHAEAHYQGRLAKAGEAHYEKTRAIQAEIRSLITKQGNATRALRRAIPTAKQFLGHSDKKFNTYATALNKSAKLRPHVTALRAIRSKMRELDKFEIRAGKLAPVTGQVPHGSKYKSLVYDLMHGALAPGRGDSQEYKDLFKDLTKKMSEPVKPRDSWEARYNNVVFQLKHQLHADAEGRVEKIAANGFTIGKKNVKVGGKVASGVARTLAAKRAQLEKHLATWPEIDKKIQERSLKFHEGLQSQLETRMKRDAFLAQRYQKKLDKLARLERYHQKSLTNPEAIKLIHQNGHVVDRAFRDERGSLIVVPPDVHDAMHRINIATHDDQWVREFSQGFGKLMTKWKVGVTVVNPGYRVRNTMSDLWNMWLQSGIGPGRMVYWGTRAAHLMNQVRKGDPEAIKMFHEAYDHGILAGQFQGDIEAAYRAIHKADTGSKLVHPLRTYASIMTTFNRHAENWGRLTHYLALREGRKMGAAEAAEKVKGAHFDYEDLTAIEQKRLKKVIPFYTWTRKNIPFQISHAITHPGRMAAFQKMRDESNNASPPVGKNFMVPSFVQQQLGFRVPWGGKGNFLTPQFGPVDVEKLQHPMQLLALTNPFIKTLAELSLNKNALTGAPIYGTDNTHPRNPISGFAAELLQNLPGTDVGPTERVVHGKPMRGPGASPFVSYFASQLPWTNFLVNQMAPIKREQRGSLGSILSQLGGLSTYKPDQAGLLAAEDQKLTKEFEQYVRGLRDQGFWSEPKKRKNKGWSKKKRRLEQQILASHR